MKHRKIAVNKVDKLKAKKKAPNKAVKAVDNK